MDMDSFISVDAIEASVFYHETSHSIFNTLKYHIVCYNLYKFV